jgi:hypothetical protein
VKRILIFTNKFSFPNAEFHEISIATQRSAESKLDCSTMQSLAVLTALRTMMSHVITNVPGVQHAECTVMRPLTTGIRSEKRVFRRFRRCTNIMEYTYTNLDSIAYYTPSLYGIAYCS